MKTLLKLCLFISAGTLQAGCSDKDGNTHECKTPVYKIPEEVYVSTPEALLNKSSHETSAFNLAIYSSDAVFPLDDLHYSTVLIYPVSRPEFFLRPHNEFIARRAAICLMYEYFFPWENSRYAKELNIEGIDHVLDLYYDFPGEGQYDFYLIFFMFKGYNYVTPVYRLTIEKDPASEASYFTNITTLKDN